MQRTYVRCCLSRRRQMGGRHHKMPGRSERNAQSKVVQLRSVKPKPPAEPLDPRLDEFRRILAQSEPIDGYYSDDEVIEDEHKFRKRFGPGFRWNRRDREGLIALKKRYDLTDTEIQMFRYTSNLHRSVFGVRLTASPWIAIWGSVQLAIFGLIFSGLVIGTVFGWNATKPIMFKHLLALLVTSTYCYGIYWFYMRPWLVQRRKESERSADD